MFLLGWLLLGLRAGYIRNISSIPLLSIYLIGYLIFGSISLLYPAIPPFATSLGATVPQVGLTVALQLYVTATLVLPIGTLSDRIDRRILLVAGISVNLLCLPLYLLTTNLVMLMVVRAINGLATACIYPAISALVIDLSPQERRGAALGWLTTGTQLGQMTGPAIGGFVLQNSGFQATFAASGILSILALLVALLRMRTVHIDRISQAGYRISFKWLWHRPGIAALLAIMFIMVGIASLLSFFPLYGIELGIDIGTVGIIIATIYLGSVLTRAMGGWISDKAGRMPVILIGLFLCAIGIFLISAFSRDILLRVAALIFGLGMGSALPACGALLADIAPDQMRGLAMGLYSASFHAGQAIGATALGIIAASTGFASMYLFTAGLICLVTLLVFVLTRGMVKSHC